MSNLEKFWNPKNRREFIGEIPQEAVEDCTVGGRDAQPMVDYWIERLGFESPEPETAEYLRNYGAWDTEELADHRENTRRLFWVVCGDLSEGQDYIYLDS